MSVEQQIAKLVQQYQSLDERTIRTYSEADTRRVFIMPLFQDLGWDVYSREEVAEEVKVATGRVDYVFKLHGVSQFYLEAKALRADLTRPDYVKQAITYAYNKGITWAVLSDFEGLQVYNAQTGRSFITLSCDNYLRDFDDLWLLSKESFQLNALNEKAEKYGALPPRLGIEQRLYNQLLQWREELSNQLHLQNEHLSISQIDEVIQRLFNRLIFIRNCEDRQIEDRVLLGAVNEWRGSGRKGELVERLQGIFRDFDGYYDSDLFAYHLTDEVFIEGTTVEHIIDGLYEVLGGMANYDFSVIDADVLGAVYEQYLGHVAAIVKQRAREAQARMDLGLPTEETYEITAKKQHRKEQGIYYTPRFVTDYIVKETVGRFLAEHSLAEIRNIKILDPACGSGSFLIRAFDELLKYYANLKISKSVNEIDAADRISILTSNIFGVDLDMQAVEIARLNLLLRSLAKRETLPSLADSICQGNSLISGTEEELEKYFGDDWRDKKPFNWEQEFKDIMAQGGFDVVIGNPPYGSKKMLTSEEKSFVKKHIKHTGSNDMAEFFISRAFELLKEGGYLGFIVPKPFTYITSWQQIREFIMEQSIEGLVDVSMAFEDVLLEQVMLIFKKQAKGSTPTKASVTTSTLVGEQIQDLGAVSCRLFDKRIFPLYLTAGVEELVAKLWHNSKQLSDIARIFAGIGGITRYLVQNSSIKGKDCLRGSNIERYGFSERPISTLPIGYFTEQDLAEHSVLRIVCQDIVAHITQPYPHIKITATIDEAKRLTHETVINIALKPNQDELFSLTYLLGLLNSKLISWYAYHFIFNCAIRTMHFRPGYADYVPIKVLDFNNPVEKKKHDDLVALAEKILEMNKRLAPIRDTYGYERDELLHEIKRTDAEIDQKVYELYGLTEEERQVIETSLVSKSSP